jgi:hypothetical protein
MPYEIAVGELIAEVEDLDAEGLVVGVRKQKRRGGDVVHVVVLEGGEFGDHSCTEWVQEM